ncbi:hypothetical protein GQ43DRAFT_474457 [Delitschia confertaspora ATCC 74209]|uniref:Mid2 domain-containing protein n=1 Tax=Delitschia confertaspora ATCC 74209 TaxID=1513339 RepID=A0A9P4JJY3_9PLEO|nr:hypothetical protein GQ43DRAFT_474457 [Delitschia confertaspora ATCC 74209]
MRKSWLLFTLFALLSLSTALDLDGVNFFLHKGKRQAASGTGNPSPSATPSEPQSTPAPTPTPTPTPSPTPSQEEPSQTPTPTPESTPEPSSNPSTPSPTPDSSSDSPSSPAPSSPKSTPASSPVSTPKPKSSPIIIITTPLVTSSVEQYLTTITITSNGQSKVLTSSGSRTVERTTGQAIITSTPQNSGSNNGGSGGGLSSKSKSIIGGVVGGVGGAILLGGIALVCWRIWGRKKRISEDDADLMAGTGSALGDKPHNANSPFQSNLEQYHNPGGRPNAAANF